MRRGAARRGASLVELLVAAALLGVVLGPVVDAVARQWRAQATLDRRRDARLQLTAAAEALRPTLRAAAGAGDSLAPPDLLFVSDTLLDLRATIGASVVCAAVDPVTIELPPPSITPPALTWWLAAPQPGDVVVVHDDARGAWLARDVASVGTRATGCAGSPLVRGAESALPRVRLRLAAPLTPSAGAPVRLLRRVRWVNYRASDGRWYLGEREWDGSSWTVTQPVAGPLRPPGPRGGLSIVARDSAGGSVPNALLASRRVARIDVVVRADVPAAHGNRAAIDSLAFTVALRNGG